MIKSLAHIFIVFSFMLFNVDFYAYSERHSQRDSFRERDSHGLKGVRAVAFGSEEAMELLSDFKEKKIEQVNSLREKGNHYRSPFTPLSNEKESPMNEKKAEVVVVQAELPQAMGLTGHRESFEKNEISFESQRQSASEIRNDLKIEMKRYDGNEDSKDSEGIRLNRHPLTIKTTVSDSFYEEDMSFNRETVEFDKRNALEIPDQNNLDTQPAEESKDFYRGASNFEMEAVSPLLRAQALSNASQPSLPELPEIQEVMMPEETKMDVESRLEALSELIFEAGNTGSLEGLKRLAQQWEDAEIQDYCSENPEDPNCMRLFSIFVNRPLKTQETKTADSKNENHSADSDQSVQQASTSENEKQSKEDEKEDSKVVTKSGPPPQVQTNTNASATPSVQMPLGHPDFYLPWERARVGNPRFAKVDKPRMPKTSEETVPQIMARVSSRETLHTQMEKFSEGVESRNKTALLEENPFFDSHLNPPVRGPALKSVPITPVREIRVKYVARPLMSPWMQWQRFQLLLEIFKPYLISDWYWMSWSWQEENQLLRNLGFKSE
jgi:hypothetical protein